MSRVAAFEANWYASLEGKVDSVLQREIDQMLSWISILLAKQKKSDFKPKEDDLVAVGKCTEVAIFI